MAKKSNRIFLSPRHMGGDRLNFIREAFQSNYITPLGPMVDAFEREFAEYIGIPHCLALASGTAAMHLALRELDVGSGDEVLASTLTFMAPKALGWRTVQIRRAGGDYAAVKAPLAHQADAIIHSLDEFEGLIR